MTSRHRAALALALSAASYAFLGGACSAKSSKAGSDCLAGESDACVGEDNCLGVRICATDGTWPVCECAGGSGGDSLGGSGGSTGGSDSGAGANATGGDGAGGGATGGRGGANATGGNANGGTGGGNPTGGTAGSVGTGGSGGSSGQGSGGSAATGGVGGAGSGGTSPGSVLFGEDFENPSPTWRFFRGTWSQYGDDTLTYSQRTLTNEAAIGIAGEASWADYSVEARVKVIQFAGLSSGHLAGLCFRVQDQDNFYMFGIRSSDYQGGILRFGGGSGSVVGTRTDALASVLDEWHTLKVEARGSNFTMFVDGARGPTASDASYGSGSIGICTLNATARFDDVLVTAL